MKTLFRKLKSSRLARFVLWPLAGILLPLLWWSLPLFTAPADIVVSRETTYVPEEWIVDGKADYLGYVTDILFPDGNVPEIEHPWQNVPKDQQVPSYRSFHALIEEISRDPDRFEPPAGIGDASWAWKMDYCHSVIPHQPWPTELFPEIAEIIEANSEWYDAAKSTLTSMSADDVIGFSPQQVMIHIIYDSIGDWSKHPAQDIAAGIANRFQCRAAYRFGNNNVQGGLEDLLFIRKISERHLRGENGTRYATDTEATATRLLAWYILKSADADKPPSDIVREAVGQLTEDNVIAELSGIMKLERLRTLRSLQDAHDGILPPLPTNHRKRWQRDVWSRFTRHDVDWTEMMRITNDFFDEVETLIASKPLHAVTQDLKSREFYGTSIINKTEPPFWSRRTSTKDAIEFYDVQFAFQANSIAKSTTRRLRKRFLALTLHIAAWKCEHGSWPQQLSDLRSANGGELPASLFIDPHCGMPLQYESTASGFEIRSVGENQVTDPGEFSELGAFGTLKTPNDLDIIWRWPVSDDPHDAFP